MGRWQSASYALASETTVVSDPGAPNYCGFPGLVELGAGELIVAYQRSTDEAATRDGNIKAKKSVNGGTSWGTEFTVADTANDLRDPALTKLSDGSLICSLFEWISGTGERARVVKSADGGDTWGSLIPVASAFTSWWACSAPVVELTDGDLLLPVYGRNSGDSLDSARLCRSTDGGDTWADIGPIATGGSRHWHEPHIAYDPDTGRLWCALRSDTATAGVYLSTSHDSDPTVWSTPIRLFNGSGRPAIYHTVQRLLAIDYRNTDNSSRHGLRYSADLGASWTAAGTVNSTGLMAYGQWASLAGGRLGFAWSVEVSGTRADVVYQEMTPPAELTFPQAAKVRGSRPAPALIGAGTRLSSGVGV